jgi:hypothetical protein
MDANTAQALIDRVRSGVGLQEAIAEAGLPMRETMLWFRDSHSKQYYEAKAQAQPGWKRRRG